MRVMHAITRLIGRGPSQIAKMYEQCQNVSLKLNHAASPKSAMSLHVSVGEVNPQLNAHLTILLAVLSCEWVSCAKQGFGVVLFDALLHFLVGLLSASSGRIFPKAFVVNLLIGRFCQCPLRFCFLGPFRLNRFKRFEICVLFLRRSSTLLPHSDEYFLTQVLVNFSCARRSVF